MATGKGAGPSRSADIVIIGAGITGLCIAWQVIRRAPRLQVLVLEKGAATGEGSTGASSAVCRSRYSLDDMVRFASDGIAAYRHWREFTGLSNPRAAFNEDGVLWMPGQDSGWAEREYRRMRDLGVPCEVFDDREMQGRYPALSNCTLVPDLDTGAPHTCRSGGRYFLESTGGHMDPVACADDLVEACRGAGVKLRFGAGASDILCNGGSTSGVMLADGERISAPLVVNAAGPWCMPLLERAGLKLPWRLSPTRIQILYLDRPPELPGRIPVCVDMAAGIYFRTQNRGQQLVVGSTLEEDEQERVPDPDQFNRSADDEFSHRKLHALHHRLPALPYRGKVRGYSGLYTVNEQDVHPLVGPSGIPGLFLANGFSGHGFKLAPAVGALLAAQLTGERCGTFDTAVEPGLFAVDRQPIALASRSVLA